MAIADLCGFSQAFEKEINRARSLGYPLSALCVELGTSAAADVVERIEHVLGATSRASDMATRASDKEFVLLLPETSAEGAEIVARRLYGALRESLWVPGATPVHVGVAALAPEMSGLALLAAAREASEHARTEGASAVHVRGA
ncbi:MAG: diguanylate cyclase [Myxococcales bacterium]|nr:diguanylate cyclase [Myxococcales bacterium]